MFEGLHLGEAHRCRAWSKEEVAPNLLGNLTMSQAHTDSGTSAFEAMETCRRWIVIVCDSLIHWVNRDCAHLSQGLLSVKEGSPRCLAMELSPSP